jgi:hypothetical protein
MACRDAREYGAGQRFFPDHLLTGCDHRERARGRDAEPVHRFADEILAQHRADCRTTVASAREWRAAGALHLDIVEPVIAGAFFAEQQRTTVAQLRHEVRVLVPGVGHRERACVFGHAIARKQRRPLGAFGCRCRGREAEVMGKRIVEDQQSGRRYRYRQQLGEEARRKLCVAMFESEQHRRDPKSVGPHCRRTWHENGRADAARRRIA